MMKTMTKSEERYYIAFVLVYDLLNEAIFGYWMPECDTCFEFCLRIADEFMNSDEYENAERSMYDALADWVKEWSNEISALAAEML